MSIYAQEADKKGEDLYRFLVCNIYIDDDIAEALVKNWNPNAPQECAINKTPDTDDENKKYNTLLAFFDKKITKREYEKIRRSRFFGIFKIVFFGLIPLFYILKLSLISEVENFDKIVDTVGLKSLFAFLAFFGVGALYFSIQQYKIEFYLYKQRGKKLDHCIMQPHTNYKLAIYASICGIIFITAILLFAYIYEP